MNVTAPSQNGYEPFNVAGASLHKALALTSSIRTHVEQTTQLPDWQDTSLTDAVAAARDAANMIEQNMLPSKFGIDPQLAISLARTGADQLSVMGFDSGWKSQGPDHRKAMLLHDLDLATAMLTEAASRIGRPVS